MSKSSGGRNRVCFDCRIKYLSQLSFGKLVNSTSVCSNCSSELYSIYDSIRVPKKTDIKAWKRLEIAYRENDLFSLKPFHKMHIESRQYREDPEQAFLDRRLSRNRMARSMRERGLTFPTTKRKNQGKSESISTIKSVYCS